MTHKIFAQAAPGKISATADGWTTNNTKVSSLGMTAHWIEVKDGKWKLQSEVLYNYDQLFRPFGV
jgi:hypothetical protein